ALRNFAGNHAGGVFYSHAMRLRRSSLTCLTAAAVALFAWSAGSRGAIAAEQTILGRRLAILNPGGAAKHKVNCTASERSSPNTVAGNPTVDGGVLEVIANGATPSEQSFALPQGSGSKGPFWSGSASAGYKYSDSKGQNGPVRVVKIRRRANG